MLSKGTFCEAYEKRAIEPGPSSVRPTGQPESLSEPGEFALSFIEERKDLLENFGSFMAEILHDPLPRVILKFHCSQLRPVLNQLQNSLYKRFTEVRPGLNFGGNRKTDEADRDAAADAGRNRC